MKIEADKSIIWNEAAKAGLWLGLFTGAIILVNALFTYLLGFFFVGETHRKPFLQPL